MKWTRLPPVPKMVEQSTSDLGNDRHVTVFVSAKYRLRHVIVTNGAKKGAIESETWTCDFLRGAEFTSYDAVRAAYVAKRAQQ